MDLVQHKAEDEYKCILMVDDEPMSLYLRKALVEQELRCVVIACDSGSIALEILRQQHVQLLITDYWMPGLDGFRTAQEARQICPYLPIVMLSGDSNVPKEARQFVNEFIEKGGLQPAAFIDRLRYWLKDAQIAIQ